MARKDNFLLGNGQKLTIRVEVPSGGGPKNPPYSFTEARKRFTQGANAVANAVRALPQAACPGGEAVLCVTMHPRYVSKSDFPTPLFNALGLRPIGSKTTNVKPDKWGIKDARLAPYYLMKSSLLARGNRFSDWRALSIRLWPIQQLRMIYPTLKQSRFNRQRRS